MKVKKRSGFYCGFWLVGQCKRNKIRKKNGMFQREGNSREQIC